MKKQYSLTGLLLIGTGIYFFLPQLPIPLISSYYAWPLLIILLGTAFLIHSSQTKDEAGLFIGSIATGLGIHFYNLNTFLLWKDHWGVYVLVPGLAYLVKYRKAKTGLMPAILLIGIGLFGLFAPSLPSWFGWIQTVFILLKQFWPLLLIGFGCLLLRKN